MTNHDLLYELSSVANQLADVARVETLRHFRSDKLSVVNKDTLGGFDPVTRADREAEEAMRNVLSSKRPDDSIIGEEFGFQSGTSDFTWVLDPIDGTRGYMCGTTTWGVLISVEQSGHPIFGLIDQPYVEERFQGGLGTSELKSRFGSRKLKTRECSQLKDAVLLTTFPEVGTPEERSAFESVQSCVNLTRFGLDCYGYALLALGQVDLVIEAGLNRYDISAAISVIEAAGGIVTNWQGQPIRDGGQVIAAGDRAMHTQALEMINS